MLCNAKNKTNFPHNSFSNILPTKNQYFSWPVTSILFHKYKFCNSNNLLKSIPRTSKKETINKGNLQGYSLTFNIQFEAFNSFPSIHNSQWSIILTVSVFYTGPYKREGECNHTPFKNQLALHVLNLWYWFNICEY